MFFGKKIELFNIEVRESSLVFEARLGKHIETLHVYLEQLYDSQNGVQIVPVMCTADQQANNYRAVIEDKGMLAADAYLIKQNGPLAGFRFVLRSGYAVVPRTEVEFRDAGDIYAGYDSDYGYRFKINEYTICVKHAPRLVSGIKARVLLRNNVVFEN